VSHRLFVSKNTMPALAPGHREAEAVVIADSALRVGDLLRDE
jgi:hypothetical protein